MSEQFKRILSESGLSVEEEQIENKFDELTAEEGFITNTSPVSPFWRLIRAIAVKPVFWLTTQLHSHILPNLFVKTASGEFLDILCEGIDLTRKPATKAQGVITFVKTSPESSVTIKQGTIVQSERINNTIYRLFVTEDTTIANGMPSAFVPVIAEHAGTAYNLSQGYYRILPEQVAGIARVENGKEWLTLPAGDKESDDELRERYRVQFSSVGKHHIDSVYKSMIAEVAGISVDRIYFKHDAPRGPGTANVYLLLDSGQPSASFIQAVNKHIENGYHGHGDDLECFAMPETQHNIVCTLHFFKNQGLTAEQTEQISQEVENMIRCAFRENSGYNVTKTYPFQRFSFSKLGEEIHTQFSEIESIAWGQSDILNDLAIPRIRRLTIRKGA